MAKLPSESPGKLELYPGAWERFERAVDAAVKGGPRHKAAKQRLGTRHLRASSFLFDGKSVETFKSILKRLEDRGFNGGLLNCHLDVSKPIQVCPARLACDDVVVGWAIEIDSDGRSAFVAFDADFNVVVAHA
jgi:hypothetical protein